MPIEEADGEKNGGVPPNQLAVCGLSHLRLLNFFNKMPVIAPAVFEKLNSAALPVGADKANSCSTKSLASVDFFEQGV